MEGWTEGVDERVDGMTAHFDAAEFAVCATQSGFTVRLALSDDDGFGRVLPAARAGRPLCHAPDVCAR